MSSRVKDLLGFSDAKFKWLGIAVLTFLIPLIFYSDIHMVEGGSYWNGVSISVFYVMIIWFVCREIMIFCLKTYSIPEQIKKFITVLSSGVLLTVIIVSVSGNLIEQLFTDREIMPKHYFKSISVSTIICVAVMGIYMGQFLFLRLKKSLIAQEQLKRENIQSQLETLKNQVSPHFLFNSLNTLASIIPDEPKQAVRYTEELSKAYRYILEIKNKKLITLKEELECIKAYVFMYRIRFGDNIQVSIDIDPAHHDHYIVPLSLQLLLENAIKHNIISTRHPLHIDFRSSNDKIHVKNNLQKKQNVSSSTGTGLENIRSRYKIVSGRDIDVTVSEKYFSVSIPVLEIHQYESADH